MYLIKCISINVICIHTMKMCCGTAVVQGNSFFSPSLRSPSVRRGARLPLDRPRGCHSHGCERGWICAARRTARGGKRSFVPAPARLGLRSPSVSCLPTSRPWRSRLRVAPPRRETSPRFRSRGCVTWSRRSEREVKRGCASAVALGVVVVVVRLYRDAPVRRSAERKRRCLSERYARRCRHRESPVRALVLCPRWNKCSGCGGGKPMVAEWFGCIDSRGVSSIDSWWSSKTSRWGTLRGSSSRMPGTDTSSISGTFSSVSHHCRALANCSNTKIDRVEKNSSINFSKRRGIDERYLYR